MTFHLRADASVQGGIGHLMRQAAVAEAVSKEGHDVRLIGNAPSRVVGLVRRLGFQLSAPDGDTWLSDVAADDVIVFDGYHFTSADYAAAERGGATVGVVEDTGRGQYLVDVVLNQNLVDELQLETAAHTRVLVGPRYALVRQAFRALRRTRGHDLDRIAVVFGGSDASSLTERVARSVAQHQPRLEVVRVVGPAADMSEVDRQEMRMISDPDEIAEVFDEVDAAVSAAGSTTWELLCMGLPTVLIQIADNQQHVARPAADRGAALFAGGLPLDMGRLTECLDELTDPHLRQQLSTAGCELVDGNGPERFVATLLEI